MAKEDDLMAPGHRTCAGCGGAIAARMLLRATGPDVIMCQATGCMEVATTPYPETAWKVPWIHSLFENPSSVASGVVASLKKQGNDHTKVICFAGDGSTYDIGFGCISGMFERNDDVLYVCYDNEAYMNTGIQKSGGTPEYASTTTSPPGKHSKGRLGRKKPLVEIAAAHGIPYAATASIGYPADFKNKVKKALSIKGAKFIVVYASCPTGWGIDGADTITLAKSVVQTGMWPLYEIENGVKKFTLKLPERKPVSEYLGAQKRFKHLKEEDVAHIQKEVDEYWEKAEKSNCIL